MLAHVGDSRAYRLRGNQIEQLTFDHSLVWEIKASGQLVDGEMPSYISRNIITRSLGPHPTVQVDLEGPHPLQVGDTFLLCSDGLSGQVKDEEIGLVLRVLPPAEAAQALIDLAILRGGPDNITVVVVRVLGPQIAQKSSDSSKKSPEPRPAVHPLTWIIAGVAALAAAGMFAMAYLLIAFGALLLAAAAVCVALWQRYGDHLPYNSFGSQPLGRGPYVTAECAPNAELLAGLTGLVERLRAAAAQETDLMDWPGFEQLVAQAASFQQVDNLTDAAREYLHAIMFLMGQLRKVRCSDGVTRVLPM
jgi:protein phosphatase